MKIPNRYDQELIKVFDLFVEHGFVPNKKVKHFFGIQAEFLNLCKEQLVIDFPVLEFGNGEFRYGLSLIQNWQSGYCLVEPRDSYRTLALALANQFSIPHLDFVERLEQVSFLGSNIVIHFDWLSALSSEQRELFSSLLLQVPEQQSILLLGISEELVDRGTFYQQTVSGKNYQYYPNWIRRMTAHMHMGVDRGMLSNGDYWVAFTGQAS